MIHSTSDQYFLSRENLSKNLQQIIDIERYYTQFLLNEIILPVAEDIWSNFTLDPLKLLPFWKNYPPEQRGRGPIGTSVPWLELGEKTISSNIIKALGSKGDNITFPGLPTGGDIRFADKKVYIHLDVKLTGPNDNANEVVVPPNQVSGDGISWNDGVLNSTWPVRRVRSGEINYHFQPKLPPIYILNDNTLICLTYFFDAIYDVTGFGNHPIKYFELVCVPNGLLMFDGPKLANTPNLIIAGKDDKTTPDDAKRIRIRLEPLSKINNWRATKIKRTENGWIALHRNDNPELFSS